MNQMKLITLTRHRDGTVSISCEDDEVPRLSQPSPRVRSKPGFDWRGVKAIFACTVLVLIGFVMPPFSPKPTDGTDTPKPYVGASSVSETEPLSSPDEYHFSIEELYADVLMDAKGLSAESNNDTSTTFQPHTYIITNNMESDIQDIPEDEPEILNEEISIPAEEPIEEITLPEETEAPLVEQPSQQVENNESVNTYKAEIPEEYVHIQFVLDNMSYNENWTELDMLACTIYEENGGDGSTDTARHLVGEVVVNRIADPRFPNTMYDVLMAKGQYSTNYWDGLVWPSRAKKSTEWHAVERAYTIAQDVLDGNKLCDLNIVWQAGHKQGTGSYLYDSGHWFCY